MAKVQVHCDVCGKGFPKFPSAIKRTSHHYCSQECYKAAPKVSKKVLLLCSLCGKPFETYPSLAARRNKNKKYCSPSCSHSAKVKEISFSDFRLNQEYSFQDTDPSLGNYPKVKMHKNKINSILERKVNHYFFQDGLVDEVTAYVYGMLITDGCWQNCHGKNKRLTLKLAAYDRDIVEKVAEALEVTKELVYTEKTSKFIVYSDLLFHDSNALGCGVLKTETANYPVINDSLDRHLIRGIIDGDGSWTTRKKRPDLNLKVCGNQLLIYGLSKKIYHHLGIMPSELNYPIDYDSRYKMESFCFIRYPKQTAISIRDWLYEGSTIYSQRKYDISNENNILGVASNG